MPMTIGIDASRAMKKEKTGVEWYAYYLINALIKSAEISPDGNKFILYCNEKPDAWLRELGKRENVKIKQLRWPLKYLWTQGRLSLEILLYKIHEIASPPIRRVAMTADKPDVLFIPASAMPIVSPKNTVVTIHDIGFMAYPQSYSRWQQWYQKWSTKFAVRHASKIITISEFSKREIIKYFTPSAPPLSKEGNNLAGKISVTYLGYDQHRFKDAAADDEILKRYNITSPFFLFVGRLEKKKNVQKLVEAFNILKRTPPVPLLSKERMEEIKLVLAGSPGFGWQEAEKVIAKNNLQNDIIVTGYVPEADLPALYRGAVALVFPSLYEGFGLPLLEAFAFGTPVICSNAASLPEIADNAALYFSPNDVENMARALVEILSNEDLRQKLIAAGKQKVKEFSWEKCAAETLKILSE